MILVILVLLALTVWATAGMPATGAAPSAPGDADVVIPAPEVRSRGPPASSVRLARPTAEVPVLSVRPAVPRSVRSANDVPSAGPHPTDP